LIITLLNTFFAQKTAYKYEVILPQNHICKLTFFGYKQRLRHMRRCCSVISPRFAIYDGTFRSIAWIRFVDSPCRLLRIAENRKTKGRDKPGLLLFFTVAPCASAHLLCQTLISETDLRY